MRLKERITIRDSRRQLENPTAASLVLKRLAQEDKLPFSRFPGFLNLLILPRATARLVRAIEVRQKGQIEVREIGGHVLGQRRNLAACIYHHVLFRYKGGSTG